MALSYEVVHRSPGRIRLRVPEIKKKPYLVERLQAYFASQPGFVKIKILPACASVAVWFEPDKGEPKLAGLRKVPSSAPTAAQNSDASASAPHEDTNESKRALIAGTAAFGAALAFRSATWVVSPMVAFAGLPILRRAVQSLREDKRITVDVLDASALTTLLLRGSPIPAAFMAWLIAVGDSIRDKTVEKSRRAISELMSFRTQKAWVLRDHSKKRIPVDEIKKGDVVIAYSGDMILVDGSVISGKATVDQKSLTGESLPVFKKSNDKVFASTSIQEGKLYIRAEKVGQSTRAATIVQIVEDAPRHETRIANFARRFADKIAGPTLLASFATYALTRDLNRAASIVILDFGTGMRVAAPTVAVSTIAQAAKRGILIKGGAQLEKMTQLDTFIFDKTGTLTRGNPEVTRVYRYNGYTEDKIIAFAAAAEKRLQHPVAKAISRAAKQRGLHVPERDESEYIIGMGVKVKVEGYTVHAGSLRFFENQKISCKLAAHDVRAAADIAQSPLFVGVDGELVGMMTYADPPRWESAKVIDELKRRGIKVVMLTGDSPPVARAVARQLHIDEYVAEVFPEQKAEILKRYQAEGRVVGMIGDGVNDSPALALADVGFAVRNGAEVSREVADVVLLQDDLGLLIETLDLSHDAMRLIKEDFGLIAVPNALALGLASIGRLNPVLATLINNGSTVAAVLNSLRPLLRSNERADNALESPLSESGRNHLQQLFPDDSAHLGKQVVRA